MWLSEVLYVLPYHEGFITGEGHIDSILPIGYCFDRGKVLAITCTMNRKLRVRWRWNVAAASPCKLRQRLHDCNSVGDMARHFMYIRVLGALLRGVPSLAEDSFTLDSRMVPWSVTILAFHVVVL